MSLKYALLGIIDTGNRSLSGYDIKKAFDSSMQFYWNATYTQIYGTLRQLHDDGLLNMEVVSQDSNPNKKVYQITDAGREALTEWVAKPFEMQKTRNEMLVQITLADRLDGELVVIRLEEYILKVRETLSILQSNEVQSILSRARTERERFFWEASLNKGVLTYQRELEWAEGVLRDYREQFVD